MSQICYPDEALICQTTHVPTIHFLCPLKVFVSSLTFFSVAAKEEIQFKGQKFSCLVNHSRLFHLNLTFDNIVDPLSSQYTSAGQVKSSCFVTNIHNVTHNKNAPFWKSALFLCITKPPSFIRVKKLILSPQ